MKNYKRFDKKLVQKSLSSEYIQAPKKLFKHRDRGIHHGRVRVS